MTEGSEYNEDNSLVTW